MLRDISTSMYTRLLARRNEESSVMVVIVRLVVLFLTRIGIAVIGVSLLMQRFLK